MANTHTHTHTHKKKKKKRKKKRKEQKEYIPISSKDLANEPFAINLLKRHAMKGYIKIITQDAIEI